MRERVARFGERVLDALTENLAYKGLSLGFAVAIWAWVQTGRVVEARVRVRVLATWPEELVPVEPLPDTLVLTVAGPQGLVRSIDQVAPRMHLDLTQAPEGSLSVDFTENRIDGLPDGLEVTHISPPGVTAKLETRRVRKVEVQPQIIGEVARGWQVVSVEVVPDTVLVSGPESVIRSLQSVTTDIVDVAGITSDLATEVPIAVSSGTLTVNYSGMSRVEVDVEPVVVTRTFNDVAVASGEDMVSEPDLVQVVLKGNQDEIEELEASSLVVSVSRVSLGALPARARWEASNGPTLTVQIPESAPSVEVVAVRPSSVRLTPAPDQPPEEGQP